MLEKIANCFQSKRNSVRILEVEIDTHADTSYMLRQLNDDLNALRLALEINVGSLRKVLVRKEVTINSNSWTELEPPIRHARWPGNRPREQTLKGDWDALCREYLDEMERDVPPIQSDAPRTLG